jgi:hypothetical protein
VVEVETMILANGRTTSPGSGLIDNKISSYRLRSVSPWSRPTVLSRLHVQPPEYIVLIHMFPPRRVVIPYMLSGGGGRQPDGRKNPAWDWRGRFRDLEIKDGWSPVHDGAVYKLYVSDHNVLDEYQRWVRETLQKLRENRRATRIKPGKQ